MLASVVLIGLSHSPVSRISFTRSITSCGFVKSCAGSLKSGFKYRRLILVIGVMEDKDIGRLIRGIVPVSDYVIYTRPVYSRAANPEILAAEGASSGKPGEVIQVLTQALDRARQMAEPRDLIVVTGSLFTVGEALTYFDPEAHRPDVI